MFRICIGCRWRVLCSILNDRYTAGWSRRCARPRSAMRVLYLVPQPKQPGRIAAYSFLDEEIESLAAAGVDAYVLSTAVPEDLSVGSVRLLSIDSRRSALRRLGAAAWLAKWRSVGATRA